MATKALLSVYLDPDIMRSLAAYAARREQSRSLIAEAAIASFLSPDAAERQEAVVTRRLDQFDRRMHGWSAISVLRSKRWRCSSGSG